MGAPPGQFEDTGIFTLQAHEDLSVEKSAEKIPNCLNLKYMKV